MNEEQAPLWLPGQQLATTLGEKLDVKTPEQRALAMVRYCQESAMQHAVRDDARSFSPCTCHFCIVAKVATNYDLEPPTCEP